MCFRRAKVWNLPGAPDNLPSLAVSTSLSVCDPPDPYKSKIDLDSLPRVVPLPPAGEVPFVKTLMPVLRTGAHKGAVALMDKPHPHSLFELMAMQAGENVRSSLSDLSYWEQKELFRLAYLFASCVNSAEYAERFDLSGGLLRFSFNHDPFTHDRPGLQYPIRRLHLHMYVLDKTSLCKIQAGKVPLGQVTDASVVTSLLDPVSFLAPMVLRDLLSSKINFLEGMEVIYADPYTTVSQGLPLGLNIRMADGWKPFLSEEFGEWLRALHLLMLKASRELKWVLTGKPELPNAYMRDQVCSQEVVNARLEEVDWLSTASRDGIQELSAWLSVAPPSLLRSAKVHSGLMAQYVVLNGLAYSIGFTQEDPIGALTNQHAAIMNISIRILSHIGGAGLFGANGISAIMLNRGQGKFSYDQMELRQDFQRGIMTMADWPVIT